MPFWPRHFGGGATCKRIWQLEAIWGQREAKLNSGKTKSIHVYVHSCSPAHACVHEDYICTLCCTVGRTSECTTKANSFNLYDTQASSNLVRRQETVMLV